jgi:ligand-binding SRPBCC domain-containing protein
MQIPSIQIRRAQHGAYRLECDLWLPQPIEAVFEFFADASNLEAITPPWLRFRILTPMPVSMAAGTRLSYRLKLHGIPLRWESEITGWDPP